MRAAAGAPMETIMNLRLVIVLACTLLGLSACVIEPYGFGYGSGGAGEYSGGSHRDDGHRTWR
jgi:hypothetical protein